MIPSAEADKAADPPPFGYPTTDVKSTPDGIGQFIHLQRGSFYWTSITGAHGVKDFIHDKWASLGYETSFLGYPISDELPTAGGGRATQFQGGSIYWSPSTGISVVPKDSTPTTSGSTPPPKELTTTSIFSLAGYSIYVGYIPYEGTYPSIGFIKNGMVKEIKVPPASSGSRCVGFLKPGYSAANGDDPNATIRVWAGHSISPGDMVTLFGSSTPKLPIHIRAIQWTDIPMWEPDTYKIYPLNLFLTYSYTSS
jgi:hypothetical protein